MIPTRTLICGYCGKHNDPEVPCDCESIKRTREARRAELDTARNAGGMSSSTWRGLSRPVGR